MSIPPRIHVLVKMVSVAKRKVTVEKIVTYCPRRSETLTVIRLAQPADSQGTEATESLCKDAPQ
jgi:hypothetical protein